MKSKPTTVLLAIIAALLAANLFVNLPPQEATAQAQPPPFPPPVDDSPRLVGISVLQLSSDAGHVLRLWSDGVVEQRIAKASSSSVSPLAWDPHPFLVTGWTEIVPFP